MNTTRRAFLTSALGSAALAASASAAEKVRLPEVKSPLFSKPSKMHLGTVTYNLAEKWDVPTLIQNCAIRASHLVNSFFSLNPI